MVPDDGAFGRDGWFADPAGRHRVRYWDGWAWTAWVANGQQPFFDTADQLATAVDGARPATAMLWGLSLGGLAGSASIVGALAFPRSLAIGGGRIGSGQRLGGMWWSVAAAVAVGLICSVVFVSRTQLRVCSSRLPRTTKGSDWFPAFITASASTVGVGVVSAWPTWIQAWPAIFAFAVLAGLVVIGATGAVFAFRVRHLQRPTEPSLRACNVGSVLRGQLITPRPE